MEFINSSEQYDDEWNSKTNSRPSKEIQNQPTKSETTVESMFIIDKNINPRNLYPEEDTHQTKEYLKYDSQERNNVRQMHNATITKLQSRLCKEKKHQKSGINKRSQQNLRTS